MYSERVLLCIDRMHLCERVLCLDRVCIQGEWECSVLIGCVLRESGSVVH